jgi:hypothetical protein
MKEPPWPLQRPSALPRAASFIAEPFWAGFQLGVYLCCRQIGRFFLSYSVGDFHG